MFKKIDPKQTLPKMEEDIVKFWQENKIFEKSLENRKGSREYSFYDGPPFATGTPHYGHIVASTMKDVVPRYWTMRGFYVERKWGWDCHGLPIENIVEKELGSKTKSEIEQLGVEKFNELCRSKVLGYVDEWKKVITRLGRWADMDNAYKTMDLAYMESVWWVFKQLWEKGLIYEGYRSMHICTRCETTLSQQEVSEGYKDIKDLSAIAKFELVDEPGTFVLAWTTTPWTLIGNVALAVGSDIDYVKVRVQSNQVKEVRDLEGVKNQVNIQEGTYILSRESFFKDRSLINYWLGEDFIEEYKLKGVDIDLSKFSTVEVIKGFQLVGKKYKPLFDYYQNKGLQNEENGWKIYAGDFVTTEDGTGVVHIAPAFGEDDLNLSYQYNLPFIQHVGMNGKMKPETGEFAGLSVKPMDDPSTSSGQGHQATDIEIIKCLAKNGLLFAKEKYDHSYPHCWRCDTPLINYATTSWFVGITKIKEEALQLAQDINWSPAHMKEGRFGKWLEGARDWSISRQRFWASVMPIWRCECGEMKVFGSVKELEDASGQTVTDLHKHVVDGIEFPCEKCGKKMKRVPDVLDTWFDSGSMPYAQLHYPFENSEKFEKSFPADFIAEGVDQTRAWFYYLHSLATGIKKSIAFKNVIVNGTVLAEDGKKMSKRLQNYPDPSLMFEKYGADTLRYYLMSSPVVSAQNLNFSEKDVAEISRGMMRMLWNSYSFFVLYANIDGWKSDESFDSEQATNLLDRWILSELASTAAGFHEAMESYELNRAARVFPKYIDNLSNWYIRRSRKRFWKSENDQDKNQAYATLHYVLVELAKMMAPFTPFVAEEIYKNITGKESVHLTDFVLGKQFKVDESLNEQMKQVRDVISEGLQLRAQAKIKVRQPLARVTIKESFEQELMEIVKEELNVKEVVVDGAQQVSVVLDTNLTQELLLEGKSREIVRYIQEMRKEAGFDVDNHIRVWYSGQPEVFTKFGDAIAKETLADSISEGKSDDFDFEKTVLVEGESLAVQLKRI